MAGRYATSGWTFFDSLLNPPVCSFRTTSSPGRTIRPGGRWLSSFKPVSRPSYCDNPHRLARVWLDLLAQPAHVHIHGATVAVVIPAPQFPEDKLAREQLPAVLAQEEQQFILLGF